MWDVFNAGPDEKPWFYSAITDTVAERLSDCEASLQLRQAADDITALAPTGGTTHV